MQYNNYNNNLSLQNYNELDDIKMVFEQTNHHLGSIYCLDWSVSGRLIASGSNDRLIKLMVVPSLDESMYIKDPETLELTISGHEGTIRSVSFEPTNDLILLSGGIGNILFLK
jgi:WD40 repeat protein